MTRPTLFKHHPKTVRDSLNEAVAISKNMLQEEQRLIAALREIDRHRFYVRYGYNSLRGFLVHGLKLTKAQAQRIMIQIRSTPPDDG